jgi:hypothetical protein
MKACRNCRTIYPDDYNGQCGECGAPMGLVNANTGETVSDLSWQYATQNSRQLNNEDRYESQMKRGRYENVPIPETVMDKARDMVIVDHQMLAEIQRNNG